ncbi:MAG TPA: GDYXXLXY domain-containing protein, partial [Candidatus Udaeobacter sp.]|nr:GDYXXLXY domain-containing protein [Candidatus Udaeobacter sp.]
MNMLRILIFCVLALAQVAVPAAMIWQREQTLKQGSVWKFRTAPVDPVDAIRGRYIALRFAAEEFDAPVKFESGNKPVYAVLKQDTDGFAEVDHLTTETVVTDDGVPVKSAWWSSGKQHVS